MITVREYRKGEAATLPVEEPDPSPNWLEEMEAVTSGLVSYESDGQLLAVSGYQLMWDGVAGALAMVDRAEASGHGKALAAAVRATIKLQMARDGLRRVQACGYASDREALVFLRACGYRVESIMRKAAPDGGDLIMSVIISEVSA